MREWTREERYRVLHDPEEIRDLYEKIMRAPYRQAYHIQPVTGLSSDPNGFAYYKGEWHLFYQWCPWGAVHGLKYWYHVISKDLVSWKNAGIGLRPDKDFDNKGNHSGSAITEGDQLYFFYTGNHRDENWVRTPYTCAAYLGEDGRPVKLPAPLFGPREDHTEHQRDPKVFYVPEKGKYFIFIGAQRADLTGCVMVYESEQLLSGWSYKGELNVPGYESFGGMWECPCIGRIGGKDVLLFSPQYTKLPGRGESTNHNIYMIGSMDYDTLTFTPEADYRYLDFGFDFYAAQLASGVTDPGEEIIISWIGLPDNHYPTEEWDYEGSMTLPRKLTIRDGHLYQNPLPEMDSLREAACLTEEDLAETEEDPSLVRGRLPEVCELLIETKGEDFGLTLFAKEDGTGGCTFVYDAEKKEITADKRGMTRRFNQAVGEVLTVPLLTPLAKMRIFIDRSSAEIFFNDGEETFTMHVYPTEEEKDLVLSKGAKVTVYPLKASVTDDFVI